MSLLFRGLSFPGASELIGERTARRRSGQLVTSEQSLRNSVVWACVRLRGDLISTSPIDVYKNLHGRALEMPKPPVLVNTGGEKVTEIEWLYSSQGDLDRFGNHFSLITAIDGLGMPARLDGLDCESVTVKTTDGHITGIKVGRHTYDPAEIWHEKQFTVSGLPVGLSPTAAAALDLATGMSAQQFAADWFDGSGVPAAHLKNTAKTLDKKQSEQIKHRFNSTVRNGDVFVTGADWDYHMLGAKAAESGFIEAIHATAADLCRFYGVPGDMVDVNEQTGSVTYANITQRNLQLLIMNLGPATTRRERALSTLVPAGQYVKLNTDAVVLRMDPRSRAELNKVLLDSHQRAPSEVREKDDLPPFTPEQIAEIQALKGKGEPAPVAIKELQL